VLALFEFILIKHIIIIVAFLQPFFATFAKFEDDIWMGPDGDRVESLREGVPGSGSNRLHS